MAINNSSCNQNNGQKTYGNCMLPTTFMLQWTSLEKTVYQGELLNIIRKEDIYTFLDSRFYVALI
jgi:hypothetical protein